MIFDPKEYHKVYVQSHLPHIREYKRQWQYSKRHPEIVSEGEINIRAKNFCVLCQRKINPYNYIILGNYCRECSDGCRELSWMKPHEIPRFCTLDDRPEECIEILRRYEIETLQYEVQLSQFHNYIIHVA